MRRLALGLLVLTLLAGCDLTGTRPHRDQALPPQPDTIGVQVTKVTVTDGGVRLTVKVPAGGRACAGRPQAVVRGYDAQQVTVDTVVDTDLAARCEGTVSRTFRPDLDLQGRELKLNGVVYQVRGTDATACDDDLGCNPPADRCDPAWTRRVIPHFDLPPTKSTKVISCQGRWLVLDVTATAHSGAVQHVRWFAELDPQRRWLVVASTRTGGCVDVRLAVPGFPLRYCRGLRPPGAGEVDPAACVLRWSTSGTQRVDLPQAQDVDVVSCGRKWLVADVGLRPVVRWFAGRDDAGRWQVVATTTSAGCHDVLRAAPAFPRARCQGLAGPGREQSGQSG